MGTIEVEALARSLMDRHALHDWSFVFMNTRTTIAQATLGSKLIQMSQYYPQFSTPKEIKLIVLHEIAHALLPWNHGHDLVWKTKCLEIGGDGKTLAAHATKFQRKASKYAIVCSSAGETLDHVNSSAYNIKRRYCPEHHTPVRLIDNPERVC